MKIAAQFSSQNFPVERRDPVLRLSMMWPDWSDDNKYFLLRGMRTVWLARMQFPLLAVKMGPLEVGVASLYRCPCAGTI